MIPGIVAGAPVAGGPATTVRYWRLFILTTANSPIADNAASLSEMTYRDTPGGSNIATSGAATASDSFSGLSPSNAFDGNPATLWGTNAGMAPNSWLKYAFPVPVSVAEVTITARGDAANYGVSQTPKSFRIESSPDNSTWTTEWTVADAGAWSDGQTKTFTRP